MKYWKQSEQHSGWIEEHKIYKIISHFSFFGRFSSLINMMMIMTMPSDAFRCLLDRSNPVQRGQREPIKWRWIFHAGFVCECKSFSDDNMIKKPECTSSASVSKLSISTLIQEQLIFCGEIASKTRLLKDGKRIGNNEGVWKQSSLTSFVANLTSYLVDKMTLWN
jgi:hypothetical protein